MPKDLQDRLKQLESEIQLNRITVGFSIEDRDANGQKRWCMFSATAERSGPEGWSPDEASIVAAIVSKKVVTQVYLDAVMRRVIPKDVASKELSAAVERYDFRIKSLLEKEDQGKRDDS